MDKIDAKIVRALQEDGRLTNQDEKPGPIGVRLPPFGTKLNGGSQHSVQNAAIA